MSRRYDVVIAGAGIAGLSLSALLASQGDRSVLLLEKGSRTGGRFDVVERDGYRLDWGVHACLLGSKGSIAKVMRRCGVNVPIPPVGMALYSGGRLKPFIGNSCSGSKPHFHSLLSGEPKYITAEGWIIRPGAEDLKLSLLFREHR